MTEWTDERIPIWEPPLPGEALDSWIEAYASRLHTDAPGFLNFLGLCKTRTRRMVVALTDHEREKLSRRTGVPFDALTGMTLQPHDAITVTIRPQTRGLGRPPTWRGTSGSRYCPLCLADDQDRWQLSWRLPWVFACRRHNVLLVDACPVCEVPPLPMGRHGHADSSGRKRCTHPLRSSSALAVPQDGAVVAAQADVDEILGGEDRARVGETLRDLYVLAWKGVAVLHTDPVELPAAVAAAASELRDSPFRLLTGLGAEDAVNVAAGAVIALAAYRDDDHGGEVLDWITRRDRQRFSNTTPANVVRTYRTLSPSLMSRVLTSLDSDLQAHHRLRYGTATSKPAIPRIPRADLRRRCTMIPKLLWPSWTIRLADSHAPNYQPNPQRWALSALLLLARAPFSFSYPHACTMLGVPTSRRAMQILLGTHEGRHHPLVSVLAQLADALDSDGCPIDYERRRVLFGSPDASVRLDRKLHEDLCKRQGWRPAGSRHLRLVDLYLRHLLTGSDLTSLTGQRMDSPTVCTGWNVLRFRMPPDLRGLIVQQARAALDAHGITDEPVFWEPPAEWITSSHWPGNDCELLDRDPVHTLRSQGASLAEVASTTGLSFEDIRLHCDATGRTFPEIPRQTRRPNDPTPRVGDLGADRLRELYAEQHLSIAKIARLIGTSTSVVRGELTRTGVPLHPPGRRREHAIDREWFEREYLHRRRTIADLSAECGASRSTLARAAKGWGIKLRSPGNRTN
ncbi:TniQ family protein [Streptomyces sp. NPDC000405]|uniref:TniQ family protein n=1 Tax=Streptomyces sp. NPDC000405 TaxID=3161033 RepID=UPI00398D2E66